MKIDEIIEQLTNHGTIFSGIKGYEELIGGTVSELYLLHDDHSKYVVKTNEPQIIESEVNFLKHYKKSPLLPEPLFVESSYKYFVYTFLEGSTQYVVGNKRELLVKLVKKLLNHYKLVSNVKGWGWVDQPSPSWQRFLLNEVHAARRNIQSKLDDTSHDYVLNLVRKINNPREQFLLHGDCGVHNFIFNHNQLTGVIDPTPVIGEPLYDLIYAFCSSPDDLTKETLDLAVDHLTVKDFKRNSVYKEVLIILYIRLGLSIKHHPKDFEQYLKAWYDWVDIAKGTY